MKRTVIQHLASAIQARLNCIETGNQEWLERHTDTIESLARNFLPSGAGIDCGTTVNLERSRGDVIVLELSFHHMNEAGYYDGWTDHVVTVRPAFTGIDLNVSGRDRNGIKDYLAETVSAALEVEVEHTVDGFKLAA